MKIINSTWYEVVVRYTKLTEDGAHKVVTEQYVVGDAFTYAEVEQLIIEELQTIAESDINIKSIRQAAYSEVIFGENVEDERLFKAKVQMLNVSEKGKVKKESISHLVLASDIDRARNLVMETYKDCVTTNEIVQLVETAFLEVFLTKMGGES